MQKNKIKLFIFCSPQNPSGRIWTKDELFRLAELCLRYDVLLVCDEIHRDIVYKGQTFTSIWNAHPEIAQHSVLCLSPNKGFNLGGLKTSYVVIPNQQIRETLLNQTDMQEFFRRANLTMVVGSYFVQDGEGFVRLSIGMPRELLLEALGRIKQEYVRSMEYV